MTRILVVEDEESFSEALGFMLRREGFDVVLAGTGPDAVASFERDSPDLVLLDLMLPGMTGTDVCRVIRSRSTVPIIMVTARDSELDKVLGLELGADDYVTKPFVTKELMARIRAQIRRATDVSDEGLLECGEVRLRPDTAEVEVGERIVPLSPTEFKLLAELIGARERVVSRDDLLRNVWGYRNPGDGRVVDNLVYRLRAKMEADPADPVHLLTVRGFGYRLKA